MAFLIRRFGRLFRFIRPLKKAKRGYSEEVLYAGWVDTLPPKIKSRR
jgi:hypothetical protein